MTADGLTRRELLRAGMAGGAGFGVIAAAGDPIAAAQSAGNRPNILVVVIDSFRTDHVGVYGGKRAFTTNLNAFARESLRFTTAVPEAMPTIPARRAIMLGQRSFPFRGSHRVPGLPDQPGWLPIRGNQVTFTKLMRAAGYNTAYVTDNPHILARPYDPFRATFDSAPTVPGQVPYRGNPPGRVSRRFYLRHEPRELRDTASGRLRNYLDANSGRRTDDDYTTARVFRSAIGFLESLPDGQPFAMVVDSFNPHEPWDPPDSVTRLYMNIRKNEVKPIQPFNSPGGKTSDITKRTRRKAQALYAAELTFVDTWFGRLLDTLDARGLANNTWVVVLGDHGVLLGEHGWMGKPQSLCHREVYRVPYMIRHPERRRRGKASGYHASTHDVAPTMLAAAGLRVPRQMDGTDLGRLFAGKKPPRRDVFTAGFSSWVVAGDDRWVLISDNQFQQPRLYDKRRDPRELRDVASRHPGQVRRLRGELKRAAGGPLPRL